MLGAVAQRLAAHCATVSTWRIGHVTRRGKSHKPKVNLDLYFFNM
jgi:hypothetical protein